MPAWPHSASLARDRAEAAATADIFRAAPSGLAASLGIAAMERDGVLMVRVDAMRQARELTRAMGLGPSAADVERQLVGLRRFFGEDGDHIVALRPDSSEDAERALAAAGYTPAYPWDTFARTAAPPPPAHAGLPVREAIAAEGEAVGEVIRSAFGMPPPLTRWIAALVGRPGWTFAVAEDEGRIVSAGAVMTQAVAAWLGLGGTLPAYRGRGGQGGLFAARILAAAAAGCTLLATETGAPGGDGPGPSHRNITRAGFTLVRRRANWAAPS
jgi:hypothetical protein